MLEIGNRIQPDLQDAKDCVEFLVETYPEGGICLPRYKEGILESALYAPIHRLTYGHSISIEMHAAMLMFGVAKGHPLTNGNKRLAFIITNMFMHMNGYEFSFLGRFLLLFFEKIFNLLMHTKLYTSNVLQYWFILGYKKSNIESVFNKHSSLKRIDYS